MTTTTENLAAALREIPDDAGMIEHNPDDGMRLFCCGGRVVERWQADDECRHTPDCWVIRARAALAAYDAEQVDRADPDTASNAEGVAQAWLLQLMEQGDFALTGGPVRGDEARGYWVPVVICVSADDAEPGQVDDDTRSNGPRL